MRSEDSIDFFVVIADRKKKKELMTLIADSGGKMVHTIYGRSSVSSSFFMEAFSFIPEEHKIVIVCLMRKSASDTAVETLIRKFRFDKPNTGIAFTIPVEGLSY